MIKMNADTPMPMPMLAPVLRPRVDGVLFTGRAASGGACGVSAVANGIDGVEIGNGVSKVVVTTSFAWRG
jgi:hypothetical protein